jgi:hypothetical protein
VITWAEFLKSWPSKVNEQPDYGRYDGLVASHAFHNCFSPSRRTFEDFVSGCLSVADLVLYFETKSEFLATYLNDTAMEIARYHLIKNSALRHITQAMLELPDCPARATLDGVYQSIEARGLGTSESDRFEELQRNLPWQTLTRNGEAVVSGPGVVRAWVVRLLNDRLPPDTIARADTIQALLARARIDVSVDYICDLLRAAG